nr:PCRF domain-containing protein [Planctomycetota bacterium]
MTEATKSLLAKLDEFEARFDQIELQISDPAIATDSVRLIALAKEQGKLKSLVGKYREYKSTLSQIADAEQIAADASAEKDLLAMAKEEIEQLENEKHSLFDQMQDTLVMADDMNIGSVIMEIRAGTGGDEAALFARDLYNMYIKYADNRKWKVEQLGFSTAEKSGFREVIFSVKGKDAWSELGYEGGGHRVQRVPETESQGRVHTSAATVAVLPEPEKLEIDIAPDEVVEHVS